MTGQLPKLQDRPIPKRIERLKELAYNLWWSWHEEAQELYERLDPLLWDEIAHNPVAFLRRINSDRLEAAGEDVSYIAAYNKVFRAFDYYLAESDTWFATTYPEHRQSSIAYFSTEFGLHESLPLYAGGLGVLSGDHAKEASDLGLPFVGIGLLYHKGYFRQQLNIEGWQEDIYDEFDPEDRPILLATNEQGQPATLDLEFGSLRLSTNLWKVQVGRVPVYLLNTLLESSNPELTSDLPRLYGGSNITRLLQEMLLGIGGVRLLYDLGIEPRVWHMNEGHSAFLTIELVKRQIEQGASFHDALDNVARGTLFTTHTPVPAGLDMFDMDTILPYFERYCQEAGITPEQFLDLGRQDVGWGEKFSMPRLALRLSSLRNGVSEIHGKVSRELFQNIWPDKLVEDVPIGFVTNGVHAQTWLAPRMAALFDQYVGLDWVTYMDDPELWHAIDAIPDQVLWNARKELKVDLLWFLSYQAQMRWANGEFSPTHVAWSGTLFSRDALTIGFARRFATYKRATLLFQDIERLAQIVRNPEQPVQFVFAGKAHPQDQGGKMLIQEICRHALNPRLAGRIAFLENYDMNIARHLVRGVDVWLNNPRRPREASGTSGQKASLNGVPNLSVLDGWWAEGYNGKNGWPIGDGHVFEAEDEEDRLDAADLYRVLEEEVIPLYYDRPENGIPKKWLQRVREAIKSAAPLFTTRRMLKDYTHQMYLPAMKQPDKHRKPVKSK